MGATTMKIKKLLFTSLLEYHMKRLIYGIQINQTGSQNIKQDLINPIDSIKNMLIEFNNLFLNCTLSKNMILHGLTDMGSTFNYSTERCLEKDIRVAKTIRLKSLRDLPKSLDNKLKIIYLVRDPRGIVNSRFETRDNDWNIPKS